MITFDNSPESTRKGSNVGDDSFNNAVEAIVNEKGSLSTNMHKVTRNYIYTGQQNCVLDTDSSYAEKMPDGETLRLVGRNSGNTWFRYKIYGTEAPDGGAVTVAFDIKSIPKGVTATVFNIYTKNNGTQQYNTVKKITEPGVYTFSVDPTYMHVHGDYSGTGGIDVAFTIETHTSEELPEFDVLYTVSTYIDYDNGIPDSYTAEDVIVDAYNKANEAYKLVDVGVTSIPSKITYIGNSLVSGFSGRGMASSAPGKDYIGLMTAYLSNLGVTCQHVRLGSYGAETAETATALNNSLNQVYTNVPADSDIVIIQLGDNGGSAANIGLLPDFVRGMITKVKSKAPNAKVYWVGLWYAARTKLTTIKECCEEAKVPFIDISDLHTTANEAGLGTTYLDASGNEATITAAGVASHPGDAGFEAIANRIINTLFKGYLKDNATQEQLYNMLLAGNGTPELLAIKQYVDYAIANASST